MDRNPLSFSGLKSLHVLTGFLLDKKKTNQISLENTGLNDAKEQRNTLIIKALGQRPRLTTWLRLANIYLVSE
jgi:hypothetical protein